MSQSRRDQVPPPQRHLTMMLMFLAFAFLFWRRPPEPVPPPPAPPAETTAAAPSAAELAELLDEAPYAGDLLLTDPAWAELSPADKITALRRRLADQGDSPLAPRWHLTVAWLYEHDIRDGRVQAAKEYSLLNKWLMPNPRTGEKDKSAYRWAAQAKLHAAELFRAEWEAGGDKTYKKKAQRELDSIISVIQRYGPEAVEIHARRDGQWVKVADPYGEVLRRVDAYSRDTTMYRVLHALVGSVGWVINHLGGSRAEHEGWDMVLTLIFLAFALKLLMHPLSRKSYRSMAEMQRVQPQLQELQKKYKDNPQKLNQEMMALYSEHGINPLGGCLPMLLQIPVFIFVYQGIRAYTYQFHHVEFLWLPSLAAPDVALLIVYGVSMFVTQWLTMKRQPTPSDPAQAQTQKMMLWLMPIMFTYMMYLWKLPSAFYLYWLAFNVVSTAEQMIIHGPKKEAPVGGEAVPPLSAGREQAPARARGKSKRSTAGRAAGRKGGKRGGASR